MRAKPEEPALASVGELRNLHFGIVPDQPALMIDASISAARPAPGRSCGSCALCCKVYDVPAVPMTAGTWCRHCQPGRGCRIYDDRPQQCRDFLCLWITQDFLGPEWKPERSRFVLTMDGASKLLYAQVDPGAPQAWRKEPYLSQFRRWAEAGNRPVIVFVGKSATAVTARGETALGQLGADERVVMRDLPGGRQVVEKVRAAG